MLSRRSNIPSYSLAPRFALFCCRLNQHLLQLALHVARRKSYLGNQLLELRLALLLLPLVGELLLRGQALRRERLRFEVVKICRIG